MVPVPDRVPSDHVNMAFLPLPHPPVPGGSGLHDELRRVDAVLCTDDAGLWAEDVWRSRQQQRFTEREIAYRGRQRAEFLPDHFAIQRQLQVGAVGQRLPIALRARPFEIERGGPAIGKMQQQVGGAVEAQRTEHASQRPLGLDADGAGMRHMLQQHPQAVTHGALELKERGAVARCKQRHAFLFKQSCQLRLQPRFQPGLAPRWSIIIDEQGLHQAVRKVTEQAAILRDHRSPPSAQTGRILPTRRSPGC